ncbi:MAG: hypothetical protein V7642_4113 [Burkholderiales bacterium]|jgi:hypothetical protein
MRVSAAPTQARKEIAARKVFGNNRVNTCNPQAASASCQHSFRLSQGTGHNLAMLESETCSFFVNC